MLRRRDIQAVAIILGFMLCFYLGTTPSDEALLYTFHHRPEIRQIVDMYRDHGQGMALNANGMTFPEDLTERGISAPRLASYRALLHQAGVSWTTGDPDNVTLHFPAPLDLPGLPVKSLVYTRTPPDVLTDGRTDFYHFQPGQYQRVCRPIDSNWYLCKDYED